MSTPDDSGKTEPGSDNSMKYLADVAVALFAKSPTYAKVAAFGLLFFAAFIAVAAFIQNEYLKIGILVLLIILAFVIVVYGMSFHRNPTVMPGHKESNEKAEKQDQEGQSNRNQHHKVTQIGDLKEGFQGGISAPPLLPALERRQTIDFEIQLTDQVRSSVRELLHELRRKAFDFLYARYPEICDDDIRVNVFTPTFKLPHDSQTTLLGIYPGLHEKMDCDDELSITFSISHPEEGATGKAFVSGKSYVARYKENNWGPGFEMRKEHKDRVHPELSFVISMPVKNLNQETIAVLNVDGLHHALKLDDLLELEDTHLAQERFMLSRFLERFCHKRKSNA